MAGRVPNRFPIWAIVVSGFLIGILLVGLLIPLIIRSVETRRWDEMRRWCEDIAKEVQSRDWRRPVLRGVPVEGNAWEDYRAALDLLGSKLDVLPLTHYLSRDPSADQSQARVFVERYAQALQALRRGASHSHAQLRTDWELQSDTLNPQITNLALLAACQARFLAQEGKRREAMELLLDAAQFGEDAALNGSHMDGLIALSPLSIAMDGLKELVSPGVMSNEDNRELERELALLDQGFPREAEGYEIETMTSGFGFLQKGNLASFQEPLGISDPSQATWLYGFSDRLVMVDAFQSGMYWDRRMKEAAGKPWKEARDIQREVEANVGKSWNPLVKRLNMMRVALMGQQPLNVFRHRRAQVRLLRSAAAYRAIGTIPVLEDPYGDKILSSISGARIKLWSVGSNGMDDGGAGEWNVREGKSIVLEVER